MGGRSHSGYGDELAWAAAWLYKATSDVTYFNKAKEAMSEFGLNGQTAGELSWDNKVVGAQVRSREPD